MIITASSPNPYAIPTGTKYLSLTGVGGGGGGGSSTTLLVGVLFYAYFPGGGGASGISVTSPTIDLSKFPDARYINYSLGSGGPSDTPGGTTTFSIVDSNLNVINGFTWNAPGGGAGTQAQNLFFFNKSGSGGNGGFGGGGGQISAFGENPHPGDGGSQDGQSGQLNSGGQGGAPTYAIPNSGIGGSFNTVTTPVHGSGGGGGGGGSGGGNGGSNNSPNGGDALSNSGAGGGGAAGYTDPNNPSQGARGGNGAVGYIYIGFSS
jgi:hypothetical protein